MARDLTTEYARAVLGGGIVAGPHVRAACRRHLQDMRDGWRRGLVWSVRHAQHALDFFPDVLTVEEDGKTVPFQLLDWQVFVIGSLFGWLTRKGYRRFTRAYIEGAKGPLALDTPVATPGGWALMGDLRPGDMVFDERGRPVEVLDTTEVLKGRPCVELEFDDGERIVCDEDHEWWTDFRGAHSVSSGRKSAGQIARTLRRPNGIYESANHSVPLAGMLDCETADLPIHPYVLGAWLGDGHSDSARICAGGSDVWQMVALLESCGVEASARPHGQVWDIQIRSVAADLLGVSPLSKNDPRNLQKMLRAEGLIGAKAIPSAYLRASIGQRLALLQGLMDTDGHIDRGGRCEFTSSKLALARQVQELAHSLGLKTTVSEEKSTLNGREVGEKIRVCFTAPHDLAVFRLERKLQRQFKRHDRRRLSGQRMIVAVHKVESVPVKCITVDCESHLFLAGRNMVPTSNCGKTPLAAGIGLKLAFADREMSAEVYAAAAKKDQSMILFADVVKMVDRSPHLRRRLVKSGKNPVWKLSHTRSGSFFRPLSADKSKSGARVHGGMVDELHEHKTRYTIDMLIAGFKGRKQPMLVVTTNSGFDRNSICYEWHEDAIAVAEGLRQNDRLFSYVMALDVEDDPLEDDSCWIKTNPGLGITVSEDYLRDQVRDAKQVPGRENLVRRLNFNEWTDADLGWMTRSAWMACEEQLVEMRKPPKGKLVGGGAAIAPQFKGADCYLGLDLAFSFDLAALAFMFPEDDDSLSGWIEYFSPSETAEEREKKDRVPYQQWMREGLIHGVPGKVIRKEHIAARLAEVSGEFNVRWAAYDRYAQKALEDEMVEQGVRLPWIEHPQGFRRAGALPFPQFRDQKGEKLDNPLWMPESVTKLETRVIERTLHIQPSPVTRWQVSSVVIRNDPAGTGNRVFDKAKAVGRIDGMVAVAMADGAAEMRLPMMNLSGFLANPVRT